MKARTTSASTRRAPSAPLRGVRLLLEHSAIRPLTAVGVLVGVLAATSVADAGTRQQTTSTRRPAFDGPWSIVTQTERGACDSYRVGVDVVNSAVTYDGTAYGRVSANGAVRVGGSMGDQKAEGTGRLLRASGQGVWRASGKLGPCSGHWTAERRG
ncbi:MAG: hypothetical protein HY852_19720 [Bradyrhizobium sp.]|uniref:hypothetical protein n=1 Tax=Bradyrhizobium sp. TaxID=376 RepID=UPI0025BF64ED|nr:hypothetical protein [Bradyrhizobium sp.]MBI5264037.1 hypothetical protein [Bradyrhizobium sp.]